MQVTLADVAEGYYGCRLLRFGAGSPGILLNLYRFFLRVFKPYAICALLCLVWVIKKHAFTAWEKWVRLALL